MYALYSNVCGSDFKFDEFFRHFYAAPAPGIKFDAALAATAPTLV
jgi:hypothetical protein